ncbi:DUF938 domain-containing protein [Vreelandella jeotgali]|uniref:DUF938 domain-containing protein n=1 Tax=Vreelandella jeotgali TaxID=553386 RepID=UPI00034658FC|nr:DUF938 domain-containing protein [Halomonas jeotgali]
MPERRESPAAQRNREPILAVLREHLPSRARVLELASGSGEHGVHFARAMPGWRWQPSDTADSALASIAAWRRHEHQAGRGDNLLAPVALDVTAGWPETWQGTEFDAVVALNLIHISPWHLTTALMQQAGDHLGEGGVLFLYGPYRRDGRHTSASNEAFDRDLQARNPAWGIRDLEKVEAEAAANGLIREAIVDMPANNLSVIFRRRTGQTG